MTKAYDLTFKWEHKKWGVQYGTRRINATNLTVAVARGTREWIRTLEPKERRDVNKKLIVSAVYLGPALGVAQVKADVDRAIERMT